jgi:hypothetical protein
VLPALKIESRPESLPERPFGPMVRESRLYISSVFRDSTKFSKSAVPRKKSFSGRSVSKHVPVSAPSSRLTKFRVAHSCNSPYPSHSVISPWLAKESQNHIFWWWIAGFMFRNSVSFRNSCTCAICQTPLSLDVAKTDENGKAVHAECYSLKLESGRHRVISSARARPTKKQL